MDKSGSKQTALRDPKAWKTAKHISWPPSMAKPIVRIPLPSGHYISKSVTPRDTDAETVRACIALRDSIGIQVWGRLRWKEIISTPARSVAKFRKKPSTPRNGVQLIERKSKRGTISSAWVASWHQPANPDQPLNGIVTKGSRKPRVKKSRWFSFGNTTSKYSSSEAALAAAIECREIQEKRWMSVIEPASENKANHHPDEASE